MSIETFSEASDLASLARGIEWAEGTAFYFLVLDDLSVRDRAIADIESRLKMRTAKRLTIRRDAGGLFDQIRRTAKLDRPNVLIVTGIENVVRDDPASADDPFIRNLNATRDSFTRTVPCPILFVVPRFVLSILSAGAPDFFSTRSGVYVYEAASAVPVWREPLAVYPAGVDLSEAERTERIEDIEGMLARLPDLRRPESRDLYLNLAWRLVNLLTSRFDLDRARAIATEAFEVARGAIPQQAIAFAFNLAQIASVLGNLVEAERWAGIVAELSTEIGDDGSRLRALWVRAYVEEERGRYQQAIERLGEALTLSRRLRDDTTSARIELQIGAYLSSQGKTDEALAHYRSAEERAQSAGDRRLVAQVRWQTAAPLRKSGQLIEAEESLRSSIPELERLGDVVQLSVADAELGAVLAAQGKLEEAERAYHRSLGVVEQAPALRLQSIPPLLGLINLSVERDDPESARQLIEQTLQRIEYLKDELPDRTNLVNQLHEMLNALISTS